MKIRIWEKLNQEESDGEDVEIDDEARDFDIQYAVEKYAEEYQYESGGDWHEGEVEFCVRYDGPLSPDDFYGEVPPVLTYSVEISYEPCFNSERVKK